MVFFSLHSNLRARAFISLMALITFFFFFLHSLRFSSKSCKHPFHTRQYVYHDSKKQSESRRLSYSCTLQREVSLSVVFYRENTRVCCTLDRMSLPVGWPRIAEKQRFVVQFMSNAKTPRKTLAGWMAIGTSSTRGFDVQMERTN